MTTKEQERKALAQIKKIVEGLGANSYIGMAFDGCFEMAEENIEDDFGNSARWYIDKTHALQEQIKEEQNKHESELSEWMHDFKRLSDMHSEMRVENERLTDEIAAMKQEAEQEQEKTDHAITELSDKLIEMQKILDAAQLENLKLKAKLYDMIVAEQ